MYTKEQARKNSSKNITIPEGIEELEDGCFMNDDTTLESITLPSTLKKLGDGCFLGCSFLKEVIFNGIIREIPRHCFAYCGKLVEIRRANTMTIQGYHRFNNDGLNDVKIFGDSCFRGCSQLEFHLPESLEKFGEYSCFDTNIEFIKIPDKIEEIPKYCFAKCRNLTHVDLNNTVKIGKNAFFNTNIVKVHFPEFIEEIGNESFAYCHKLEDVIFDNVKSIGNYCFRDTWLSSVAFPPSLEFIGDYAFECETLRKMIFHGKNPVNIGIGNITSKLEKISTPMRITIPLIRLKHFTGILTIDETFAKPEANREIKMNFIIDSVTNKEIVQKYNGDFIQRRTENIDDCVTNIFSREDASETSAKNTNNSSRKKKLFMLICFGVTISSVIYLMNFTN